MCQTFAMNDSIQHQIALTLAPQIGPITAKQLVSYCGSATAVFNAKKRELSRIPGIGPVVISNLQQKDLLLRAERELAFIDREQVSAIFYTHPQFPARLRQCPGCPVLLYFKGADVAQLSAQRVVAIVGTRQPTDYGRAICEELVEGLLEYNVVIVSGLAYGIDITAHRKANALNIPNFGVLGHGLGSIYPTQHRPVAQKMQELGGLVSEYVSDTQPDREHFPMRNRIIAGLCDALLVVETAETGGSMISAELAFQYGRDIFAVPGRVKDAKSAGCNLLIKHQKAALVESVSDIADAMNWSDSRRPKSVQKELFVSLSPEEQKVFEIIRSKPEIPVDELGLTAGMPPGALAATILGLEFKALIHTLPGKRYIIAV